MPIKRKTEAIWIEKSERWQVKVQIDGKRKTFYSSKPGRKGKIEAEHKADLWLDNGAGDDPRFSELWADFIASQKKTTGTPNYKKHESVGRNYLLPALGNKRISSITRQDMQDILDHAASADNKPHGKPGRRGRPRIGGEGSGLSKKSLTNIRASLSAVYSFADRKRMTMEPPTRLTIPRNAPVGERQIIQPEGLKTLFSVDYIIHYNRKKPSHYIHAWRFAVLTGIRPGELYGLKRGDIKDTLMHICRAINTDNEQTNGKNDNAKRWFPLPARARKVLEDQDAMLKQRGIISPWLFPDETGEQTEQLHASRLWKTYRKQHNIACTPYEMRHTMISVSGADVPEKLLKMIVGHSDTMDTMGIYGHEVDGELSRAQSILDDVFDRVFDSIKS